ncbi:hypothetical protein AWB75_01644 [Caballeronia catudaia]|uniref:Uncharacterized protein n=1 Tax=Caballeronia catudaia TaxID=1777136 RepID=A0A158A2V4_9BURK|nr:hypothetical protein [Caballeronia catudaia]SAK52100.1 hypothetical protein AWB75_01644 [Caballeronia catudaia]
MTIPTQQAFQGYLDRFEQCHVRHLQDSFYDVDFLSNDETPARTLIQSARQQLSEKITALIQDNEILEWLGSQPAYERARRKLQPFLHAKPNPRNKVCCIGDEQDVDQVYRQLRKLSEPKGFAFRYSVGRILEAN